MPDQRQRQIHQDIWKLAKPRTPVEAEVRSLGSVVVIRTSEGALAVVPVDEVCKLAERYNLIVRGFKCPGTQKNP